MDAEDIFKAILYAIWYVIKFVIFVILINIIFYYLGYAFLKVITLWKYPPHDMSKRDENIVTSTGALLPFVVFACLFVVNNHII